MLKKLKAAGRTLILSEHRFYYIKDIIDRVYYIDKGKIKEEFTRKAFFAIDNDRRKNLGLRSIDFEPLQCKTRTHTVHSTPQTKGQLVIHRLYFPFKGQTRALDIRDAAFPLGTIVGIYGRNGIGKSTFIRILMGLQKAKKENIFIDGKHAPKRNRVKNSYLVMQDVNHQLFTESVETEVRLGKATSFTDSDIDRVLTALDIASLKDAHPMSLSGGQKQRVAIASAIVSGAKIICFDEPTSGMDYDNMMKISSLIKNTVKEDRIIFIISHDHEFLNNTVDEVFLLRNAQIWKKKEDDQ